MKLVRPPLVPKDITQKQQMRGLRTILKEIQTRCQCTLAEYQLATAYQIFEAHTTKHNSEVPMLWPRRSGKTETVTQTGLTVAVYEILIMGKDFQWGLVNPAKGNQSVMVTRERIQRHVRALAPWLYNACGIIVQLGAGRKTDDLILRNEQNNAECHIRAISGNPSADEKGAGFNLSVIEQVEDIDEVTMKAVILPMAAGSELQLTTVLAGTPSLSIENNYFYETTRDLKYPNRITWVDVVRERPQYLKFIQDQMAKLGEESDEFRTNFNSEWIILANRFVDHDKFRALQEEYLPDPKRFRAAGIDIAQMVDRTVVTVTEREGDQIHIISWLELEGINYETQANTIHQFLINNNVRSATIDVTGPGRAVYDILRNHQDIYLREFTFNPQNNNDLYVRYQREIDQERLHYPKTPQPDQLQLRNRFMEEHFDAIREVKNNKINIRAPKVKHSHDDYVASAALAVHGVLSGDSYGLFYLVGATRPDWVRR